MDIKNKGKIGALFFMCSLWTLNFAGAQTVMNVLENNSQTTAFAQALEQTGLDERFTNSGPFTVFAPSNQAFNNLSEWQQADESILLNHFFTGRATARRLSVMNNVTVLSGQTVDISGNIGNLSVGSYEILEANIRANNGVIHIIGGVIR